jgi:hypothetical protein
MRQLDELGLVTRQCDGIRPQVQKHLTRSATLGTYNSRKISGLYQERWKIEQKSMKMAVFWDVAPCSPVETDRRFRGAYCLHH